MINEKSIDNNQQDTKNEIDNMESEEMIDSD